MNTTATTSPVAASAPTHIFTGYADFGDVRAVAASGRIEVRCRGLYDSRDAADLAADVRGAVQWIAQHNDDQPGADAVADAQPQTAITSRGVTTWASGLSVDRSRSCFSGPTLPVATLTMPVGGYPVRAALRLLADLASVGAFLDSEDDAYRSELLNEWD